MNKALSPAILLHIKNNINKFHDRRLESLSKTRLDKILKRKNPYLFKAKNILTAEKLIRSLLDAHLSSQEEGIFGEFLEQLALFICSRVYNGVKSSTEGIDLEFERDGIRYLVAVKSGPNWGNSQQIKRMRDNFRQAKKILATSGGLVNVVAVNGCCYGKDNKPSKGDYEKLCGQRFWELISGEENLYIEIIEPLGHRAKEKNAAFGREYPKVVNRFTRDFIGRFCNPEGSILWDKLLKFNSGKDKFS
jgi:hypothetical protein